MACIRQKFQFALIPALLVTMLLGCGQDHQNEDYQIKDTTGVTLTESNHPHGYKKSECLSCHVPANIHQEDRINSNSVGLARSLVEKYGAQYCWTCHGTNGLW